MKRLEVLGLTEAGFAISVTYPDSKPLATKPLAAI
jgi:hypothetical protein